MQGLKEISPPLLCCNLSVPVSGELGLARPRMTGRSRLQLRMQLLVHGKTRGTKMRTNTYLGTTSSSVEFLQLRLQHAESLFEIPNAR